MYCKFCGAEMEDNHQFCTKCGNSLSGAPMTTQQPVFMNAPQIQKPVIPNSGRNTLKLGIIVLFSTGAFSGVFRNLLSYGLFNLSFNSGASMYGLISGAVSVITILLQIAGIVILFVAYSKLNNVQRTTAGNYLMFGSILFILNTVIPLANTLTSVIFNPGSSQTAYYIVTSLANALSSGSLWGGYILAFIAFSKLKEE